MPFNKHQTKLLVFHYKSEIFHHTVILFKCTVNQFSIHYFSPVKCNLQRDDIVYSSNRISDLNSIETNKYNKVFILINITDVLRYLIFHNISN